VSDDEEFANGRSPGKVYFSKQFSALAKERKKRFAYRVFEGATRTGFIREGAELVLRPTPSGRQQIKALFHVDDRSIQTLTLQRFGSPDKPSKDVQFTLVGPEIDALLNLAMTIANAHFEGDAKVRLAPEDLANYEVTPAALRALLKADPKLLATLISEEITDRDVVALSYRRKELDRFKCMLEDPSYFEKRKKELSCTKDEQLWQIFFEHNKWIFGYGLTFLFLSSLDDKKLEQVVVGHDIQTKGKRADALMKARGAINALCFVEIKKHTTDLVKKEYRPGCWAPTEELVGAISQVQGTVEQAIRNLSAKWEATNSTGDPTGEIVFTFRPRAFLVVGSLHEFLTPNGANVEKYRSFELFRRHVSQPEILTFDELYERARFIVEESG
jgi:hypothetical protein